MAVIGVHLQEGFEHDTVNILVNEHEVWHKADVTTKLLLGYAEVVELDVPEGDVTVQIELPERALAEKTEVKVEEQIYILVSNVDGALNCRVTQRPPGYH